MGSVTRLFDLTQFIGPDEVLTSSELVKRIQESGIAAANARQLVLRTAAGHKIWRSKHLILSGGGRLFAHQAFKATDGFIHKCLPKLETLRPGLARAVQALLREEVLLRSRAELLLASPVIPDNSEYPSYQNEVVALIELGIVRVEAFDSVMERLSNTNLENVNAHAVALRSYALFTSETFLANVLFDQFRRQNLISWNTKALPENSAMLIAFNNYRFSATGFSWLKPMLRFKGKEKPNPTPVVMDIFAKLCATYDVESFIERLTRAGQNKNRKQTFLGIIAAFEFEPKAWTLAKSEGLMTINLKQYFGESASEAFVQIQKLLKNVAGETANAKDDDYEKMAGILEQLKTNPYVVDLRSIGLEALSGLILRTHGYQDVQLNLKVLLQAGVEREADVTGDRRGREELVVVECKAEAANKLLDPAYVRKFYTETVPAYLRAKGNGQVRECRAEIWTTGQVGAEAQQTLKEIALKPIVKPALLGHDDIKALIPQTLGSCKRLLEAISVY